ncbi:malonyl-[acyl-carrier protein] O-methyltransferase [Phoenix dactylifera]|uniref:Malonyl-[acyl-carrier protein] O-methyltransferase n=1 Tax=Phoenix dactylifera TaxID=42345 RepID=A0A8B7D035_PHODC|nr:malonyl-[acyl-carrier protein] O-methyltransferase [Phoenix dactylifera]
MGKAAAGGRDWTQLHAIYGTDEWQTVAFLALHAALFASLSLLLLLYFPHVLAFLRAVAPAAPLPALRFAAGFVGSVAALSALCLLYAAADVLYSSLALRWEMAQRMVAAVPDWSAVRTALDVGCGRGMLLNAVAMQMKKEGSGGRVVGLDGRRETAVAALRRARAEGVQEYVTCREGDARRLPFADGYFDVVVSAVHLSGLGRRAGGKSPASAAAAAERGRGLGEMVRVLKPGGMGVVWDLVSGPEYAQRLREMRMEDVRVSDRVTAYMVGSHIVSFRKPLDPAAGMESLLPLDWRANIC